MSIENRNCECGYANNMQNSNYWGVSNDNMNSCGCQNATRAELLKQIKCYRFAVIELALYLDTHPDDTQAICLHNKYTKELKELSDKYQKVYGPLTIEYPCNKWRWIEEPWPWEGGIV